jgi:wyosine [tRNA(Phe)-imidazoG37] synthetase (radical SAM superfamily)
MELSKKDWICKQPFEFLEIFEHGTFMCCPDWLPQNLGLPIDIGENWRSEKANKIRESILDGSYSYCIEKKCPKLVGLKEGKTTGLVPKEEFLKEYNGRTPIPQDVKFNFDRSCNLKCPSCRLSFINYDLEKLDETNKLIEEIEKQLGQGLTRIECTGSGDPFFARSFRKWMMNFDPKKYPRLKSIHLHTNATLWNPYNWEKMKNIHRYVKSCEISIDAASKDIYENKVRLGGKWDDLVENLKYIATLPHLDTITLSFVVQKKNLEDFEKFYYFAENIFKGTNKDWYVFYGSLTNWGTFTQEEYIENNVSNPNHPEFNNLIRRYQSLPKVERIRHNLVF